MIHERDPFGTALSVLRLRLKTGRYQPGEPLPITALARELGLSPTPVREALSRLAGQGLVEDHRGRGYYAWRLDALDLVELYDLHALCVGAALDVLQTRGVQVAANQAAQAAGTVPVADDHAGEAIASASEALFTRILQSGGTRILMTLHAILIDRLGPARRVESAVIADCSDELANLVELFDQSRWADLTTAVGAYHDRRREVATAVAAAMRKYNPNR